MPRKAPELDLDFKIYVDSSCLSEPMEDETLATQVVPSADEAQESAAEPQTTEEPVAENETNDAEQPGDDGAAEDSQEALSPNTEVAPAVDAAAEPAEEEALEPESQPEPEVAAQQLEDAPPADTPAEEEQPGPEHGDAPPAPAEEQVDTPATALEKEAVPESEQAEHPAADGSVPEYNDHEGDAQEEETGTPEVEVEQQASAPTEGPASEPTPEVDAAAEAEEASDPAVEESGLSHTSPTDESAAEEGQDFLTESDAEAKAGGHRELTPVDRKTSLRTEALIQAAARAVVAKIEKRNSGHGTGHEEEDEFENLLLSTGSQDTYVVGDAAAEAQSVYNDHHSPSHRPSSESQVRHIPSRSTSSDEGGGNSSHNEPDDDVFSDRSARSSVCSLDPHDMDDVKTPHAKENLSRRESFASSRQSPRVVSGLSAISGLSQYDKDQFVPTSRENRMPFRSPSEIRAIQMSSPTPSVFNGSSPRSSKRHGGGSTGFPPMSRLSSPIASAQYSPKGRSTPPRFKSRKEAPLVLLHVTLLPLRWVWGDVLNGLDTLHGKSIDEAGSVFEPSEQLKTLRDSWRQLQDRVGDTVLERGILLPHPQNDYEMLEERLLEALELPLRRRARILECGHYLGPANEMGDEEEESDDEYASQSEERKEEKRHWCNTCRNEIKYEDLGPGKVFRIKVYASNGLMRAGAWEACWKEMERVDVEVEPIIDSAMQNELEKLGALQLEQEEQQRRCEMELDRSPEPEPEQKRESTAEQGSRTDTPSRQYTNPNSEPELSRADTPAARISSPPPPSASNSLVRAATPAQSRPVLRLTEPIDTSEERRRRDEERLREIYGDMPPAAQPQPPAQPLPAPTEHHPHQHHHQQQQQLYPHSHALLPVTPSPPPMLTDHMDEDPYSREREKRPPSRVLDENSGFVELLMEAFKVLLRDPKNVAIIVLCVFLVVMMKARGGQHGQNHTAIGAYGYAHHQGQSQGQVQGQREVVGEKRVAPVVDVDVPTYTNEVSSLSVAGTALPAVAEDIDVVVSEQEVPSVAETVAMEQDVVAEQREQILMHSLEPEVKAPAEEISGDEIPAIDTDTLGFSPVSDILAGGFELPTSVPMEEAPESVEAEAAEAAEIEQIVESPESLGSEPSGAVEPSPEVGDTASATGAPSTSESAAELEDSAPFESKTSASPTPESTIEVDDAEQAKANAAANDSPSAAPEATEPEEEEQPINHQCEIDFDMDSDSEDSENEEAPLPTPSSTTPSSSSVFVPGPLVTERKTVRVFETVTETVRVSVVTQTETVSTVVTAVPQTVEETVYETETVRITVSVPVEEQGKKARPTGSGSGKKGRGGTCGGWF
ncbi:hypothetical protein C8A03DRAFT_46219 [Achaetomium macrosporum]|uniref:Pathway-specific nitrogen regulator n=1 Tax=Achaetomium macrosporum TaxID=79813 RepID=A0AAN7H8Y3_9PEZI|nr:hypothetical protein C8A03DRAFT_46219 [Achaetomium macrosporum]